ncbi:MAG: PQQ-binding-like beta-propeller repeat protein [Deltaproteobacteria bacterium]|nr:PQQ-binding-like beta-propeller repeat protein [Deltaproteobacteria bacterium]
MRISNASFLLLFLFFVSCQNTKVTACPAPKGTSCPPCKIQNKEDKTISSKPPKPMKKNYNCSLDLVAGRILNGKKKYWNRQKFNLNKKPSNFIKMGKFSRITSTPLINGNKIFFGDHTGNINSVSLIDGNFKTNWKYKTGDKIWGDPILSRDGKTLYSGSDDDHLYAISVDSGKLLWKIRIWECSPAKGADPEKVRCDIDGSLFLDSTGNVIVGGAGVASVSPEGKVIFLFKVKSHVRGGITADNEGNLFFATLGGEIISISSSGKERFRYSVRGQCDSRPLLAGCLVITGCDDNAIHALNRETGKLVWKFIGSDDFRHSGAFSEDTIYWGGNDGYIYAIDLKGNIKWRYNAGGRVLAGISVNDTGETIFGCENRNIFHLNSSGNLKWNIRLKDIPDTTVSIMDNGIILGTWKGTLLYADSGEK